MRVNKYRLHGYCIVYQNNRYILIIPGFGIISNTISASSNKNIFGQNGSLIGIFQLTQQTICRKLIKFFFNLILLNTKNISNTVYSLLVKILIILSNPQITKAQSENFKSNIIVNIWLCMWVGISEAIRLLSTSLKTHFSFDIISNIVYTTNFALNAGYNHTTANKSDKNKGKDISHNGSNKPHGSQHKIDKFNEWLAGLIDGDGCFQLSKKGYASLEIVMELRDKHCLYLVKQLYGGSVKLRGNDNHLRYRLHHKTGLLNLVNAVNGLIRNPVRILQMARICRKYGMELKDTRPLTYYSGWFSGFFDSDGSIYMNNLSGQLFVTVSQKNRFLLDDLVKLYGGQIYTMVKQDAFKWTCFKNNEIVSLCNHYFRINPCKSEKRVRITKVDKFYELKNLHADNAKSDSILGKTWKNFTLKWNSVIVKEK